MVKVDEDPSFEGSEFELPAEDQKSESAGQKKEKKGSKDEKGSGGKEGGETEKMSRSAEKSLSDGDEDSPEPKNGHYVIDMHGVEGSHELQPLISENQTSNQQYLGARQSFCGLLVVVLFGGVGVGLSSSGSQPTLDKFSATPLSPTVAINEEPQVDSLDESDEQVCITTELNTLVDRAQQDGLVNNYSNLR